MKRVARAMNKYSYPTPLIIDPTRSHTASVIWLHGFGDTAKGWSSAATEVFSVFLPSHRIILGNAPTRPVTAFFGQEAPAWYDLTSFSSDRGKEACEGLEESKAYVESLIAEEVSRGIPRRNIALGGFSQGSALALFTGLQIVDPLGGVIVLSGYLPKPSLVVPSPDALRSTVFSFFHGAQDELVPTSYLDDALQRVKAFGVQNVSSRIYPEIGHSVSEEELEDVCACILKHTSAASIMESSGSGGTLGGAGSK